MKSVIFVTLMVLLSACTTSAQVTSTMAATTSTMAAATTAAPPNTTVPLTTEVMTAGYVRYLQQTFPFLQVFYLETFKRCTSSFENYCFPALELSWPRGSSGVATPMQTAWSKQAVNCLKTYCSCWPGGILESNFGSLQCRVPSLTQEQLCIAEEYCAAANSVCYMDWMYGITNVSRGQLPQQCDSFLDCAARPSVVEDTFKACVADPPTKTLQGSSSCNASITCSYTKSQLSDSNITQSGLIDQANAKEDGLSTGSRSSVANSIAYTVMIGIGLLVVFIILMIGYAFIRYRNVNRMFEAQEAARSLTGDELRNETHVTAKWYGAPLVVKLDTGDDAADEDKKKLEENVCVFSGKPNAKFMLLPCRSRWCGCETPKSKKHSIKMEEKKKKEKKRKEQEEEGVDKEGGAEEKKESSVDPATGEPKHVCCIPDLRPTVNPQGEPVEEIIDMSLYETSIEGAEKGDEENRKENASSTDDDTTCVICMDNKAIVAFFPCTHRATCGSCGKRIVEGDAVARQTQVQNFAKGKKTAAPCPLCRAEIEFAVVLESDPEAEEQEELDENGFNVKPLNALTGQLRQNVLARLKAFYKKYNPDGVKKIEDLFKYAWTEGEVMYKLMGKYCPTEQGKLKRRDTTVEVPPPPATTGTSPEGESAAEPSHEHTSSEEQQQRQVSSEATSTNAAVVAINSTINDDDVADPAAPVVVTSSASTGGGSSTSAGSNMVEDVDGGTVDGSNAVEMKEEPSSSSADVVEQNRDTGDATLDALLDSDKEEDEDDDESSPPPPLPVQEEEVVAAPHVNDSEAPRPQLANSSILGEENDDDDDDNIPPPPQQQEDTVINIDL